MKHLMLLAGVLSAMACNNNRPNTKQVEPAGDFFPIAAFLNEQIKKIDSLQLPIASYYKEPAQADTLPMDIATFKKLSQEFIEADISNPAVKKWYKESSFADQSIPSVNLTYLATNPSLPVQRIDVVIKPDPVSDDKVSSIYIEKISKAADTVITKKLYWKADKNFQVFTAKEKSGMKPVITQLKVVWDPSE
jgi:hypothetical protein